MADGRRQVAVTELVRRGQADELPLMPQELVWIQGSVPDRQTLRLAVVGAREATDAQKDLARRLGHALSAAGVIVASGGADGVDTAALTGALEAGGRPLVVLGSGLDHPYPASNASFFQRIADAQGTLVSQFACEQRPLPGQFPRRNILLTRLVDAVIVVCAGNPSGTLHCAEQAVEAGIPVLAVPWTPDTPKSEGSNWLLGRKARALWNEASAVEFALALARGDLEFTPMLAERRPKRRTPPRRRSVRGTQVIDGAEGATPCYRPEAVTAGAARQVPVGCDPALVQRLTLVLGEAGPPGLTIEELACALAMDRGAVAALCLGLVLHGWLARAPGGLMSLRG